jgi:hypothetical protein
MCRAVNCLLMFPKHPVPFRLYFAEPSDGFLVFPKRLFQLSKLIHGHHHKFVKSPNHIFERSHSDKKQHAQCRPKHECFRPCVAALIVKRSYCESPDRYRPDFAASLSNLGVWLSELGRPAEAEAAHKEAEAMQALPAE